MFSKKQQDLKTGFDTEAEVFAKLKTLPYCEDLELISGYSIIDGKGANAELELKSRRIVHNEYPTAIIGCNKIDAFSKNGKLHNYVCWKYNDGIFYLKINLDHFKNRYKKGVQRVERDGKVEYSDCFYIPYNVLSKLE
jgi:hypothetical protein